MRNKGYKINLKGVDFMYTLLVISDCIILTIGTILLIMSIVKRDTEILNISAICLIISTLISILGIIIY